MSIPFFYWCYTNRKIIHNVKSKIRKTTETQRMTLIYSRSQKLNCSLLSVLCCAICLPLHAPCFAVRFCFWFGLRSGSNVKGKEGNGVHFFLRLNQPSLDISYFVVSNGWNVGDGNEKNNYLIMHSSFLFQLTANLISNLLFIVYNVIFIQFSFLQYEI